MTIAQYKIRHYCTANGTYMHKLSEELGYDKSYLGHLALGKLPDNIERHTINEFFGIIDESKLLKQELKNKYRFATVAKTFLKLDYGIDVSYDAMINYFRGRRPREKRVLKALCKMCNIKNEWTEKLDTVKLS